MKSFSFKSLIFLLLLTGSLAAQSAQMVLYIPADYTPSAGNPVNVKNTGDFPPICEDGEDIYSVRLEGLDLARGYSQGQVCPISTQSASLTAQASYVFLVDDTQELSDYLKTQMRLKNALQSSNGREIIKPTVVNFESSAERQGFNILIVGEMAFAAVADSAAWLAALNQRFSEDQVVAGGSAADGDEIWMAYHGSFFNSQRQEMLDVTIEKITQFFQKQWQEAAQQTGAGVGTGAAGGTTPSPATTTALSRPMNDYMRLCNAQGVPLPPIWNPTTGTNQWQRVGAMSNPFISTTLNAEVWKFESTAPVGICIALPRMRGGTDVNTDVSLLGIICQSETTGKACFWDNVERPSPDVQSGQPDTTAAQMAVRRPTGGARISGAATRDMDAFNIRDGYNLSENCSQCHRGDNVFLIHPDSDDYAGATDHPGSPLDGLDTDITGGVSYAPISGTPPSPAWRNLPIRLDDTVSPTETRQLSGCTTCHGIPELSVGYCEMVLENAIGSTMPPSNPQNWRTSECDAVRLLAKKCAALPGKTPSFRLKGLAANASNCNVTP